MITNTDTAVSLPKNSNQALGIGTFAIDFMSGVIGEPSQEVYERTALFFTDAVLCGLSALAVKTNAPTILRNEAMEVPVRCRRNCIWLQRKGLARKGHSCKLRRRSRMGFKRNKLWVQPRTGTHGGRIRSQRFLRGSYCCCAGGWP